jgi:hypothetical protein
MRAVSFIWGCHRGDEDGFRLAFDAVLLDERSQCIHLQGQAAKLENCLTLKMKALSYSEMLITIVQWQCHILEDQNFGNILVMILFP